MPENNFKAIGSERYLQIGREWFHYNPHDHPVGAGAMGTVYLGRHKDDNHNLVAIKIVNPKYSNIPAIRERARLEASLAFRHRNLVEMVGLCEVGGINGPLFIVSRFVQGITLDTYVRQALAQRPDKVKRIINCMFPVLDALDFIHEKGIVHLDIKPSNIMIENGCNVRLMDLGIAYTGLHPGMTASGLLGTPGYAAPEQYLQPGQTTVNFDARTDIYQLGATIYELIGNEKPYSDGDALAPLPGVSNALMKVIARSLHPQQDKRYSSAHQFATALHDALSKPPSLWEKLFKRRH